MKQHFKRIFTEIFNNRIEFPYSVDPAELSESTQHLLSAYIEAELDGKKAATLFPDVQSAIAAFPEFEAEYKILYELLDAERRGTLEQPPFIPEFDFSYLNLPLPEKVTAEQMVAIETAFQPRHGIIGPQATNAIPWIINMTGNLVIQFSQALIDSLPHPPIHLAPVRNNAAEDNWQTWLEYKLPRPTTDLDVIVSVKHIGHQNDFCKIVVTVEVPSLGGWPELADSQVQLSGPSLKSEWIETDAFGQAVFEGIEKKNVPYLKFEVNPVNV